MSTEVIRNRQLEERCDEKQNKAKNKRAKTKNKIKTKQSKNYQRIMPRRMKRKHFIITSKKKDRSKKDLVNLS